MERRKFIRNCCYATLGTSVVLESCASIYYATTSFSENRIVIPKSEFHFEKKGVSEIRDFVFVKRENVRFPICVYKINEDEYVASLMMCTHNQCELEAAGGIYACPCHGSEFSNTGEVLHGPAERDLRTYKTSIEGENIYVHIA